MYKKNSQKKNGFTLIEMLIAISIFLILLVFGMSALMNAFTVNKRSQAMRSIMDNLSFVMDQMSNDLRTGSDYNCGSLNGGSCYNSPQNSIYFKSSSGLVWAYKIKSGGIYKNTNADVTNSVYDILLTDSTININSNNGFEVYGQNIDPPEQPFVVVRLKGLISYRNTTTSFLLQTSVSQRNISLLKYQQN